MISIGNSSKKVIAGSADCSSNMGKFCTGSCGHTIVLLHQPFGNQTAVTILPLFWIGHRAAGLLVHGLCAVHDTPCFCVCQGFRSQTSQVMAAVNFAPHWQCCTCVFDVSTYKFSSVSPACFIVARARPSQLAQYVFCHMQQPQAPQMRLFCSGKPANDILALHAHPGKTEQTMQS